jgi:hypothetical protein
MTGHSVDLIIQNINKLVTVYFTVWKLHTLGYQPKMILVRDWMSVVMTYFKERGNYEKQENSESGIDLCNV